jgi:PAS domain S-box-containing protein
MDFQEDSNAPEDTWITGVYATFHTLSKVSVDASLFRFVMCVVFLQELAFPLSLHLPSNTGIMLQNKDLGYFLYLWTNDTGNNSALLVASAYGVACLILASCMYIVYVVYINRSGGKGRFLISYRAIRYVCYLWSSLLLVPMIGMMMRYLKCATDDNSCSVIGAQSGEAAFLILVTIIHVGASVLFEASLFEWKPFSKIKTSCYTWVPLAVSVSNRALKAFLFGLLDGKQTQSTSLGLAILSLFSAILVTLTFWFYLPFYYVNMNNFYVISHSIVTIASLSTVLGIALNNPNDSSPTWLFILGVVLVVPSALFLISYRRKAAHLKNSQELQSPIDAAIKAIVLCEKSLTTANIVDDTDHVLENIDEIELLFKEACGLMANSYVLHIMWGCFIHRYKRKTLKAISIIKQLIKRSPSFLDLLIIQLRMRDMAGSNKDKTSSLGSDALLYEEQQRLELIATQSMIKCMVAELEFWSSLGSSSYTMITMAHYISEINRYMDNAKESLLKLISVSPRNPFYRRLYAQFLVNIANDETNGSRQLSRAIEIEGSEEDESSSLNKPVIVVSAEKETLGKVLSANTKACELLGYNLSLIVEKSVNALMPRPYAEKHSRCMTESIERSQSTLSENHRISVLFKNAQGFIFEAENQIVEYPHYTSEPSVTFLALIFPKDIKACLAMIRAADLLIVDVSMEFARTFNCESGKLRSEELVVSKYIPQFNSVLQSQRVRDELERDGVTNPIKIEAPINPLNPLGERAELKLIIKYSPYLEKQYYTIHVYRDAAHFISDMEKNRSNVHSAEALNSNTVKASGVRYNFNRESEDDGGSSNGDSGESDLGSEKSSGGERTEETRSIGSSRSSRSSNLVRVGLERLNHRLDPALRRLLIICCMSFVALVTAATSLNLIWADRSVGRFAISNHLVFSCSSAIWAIRTCEYSASVFKVLDKAKDPDLEAKKLLTDLSEALGYFDTFMVRVYSHVGEMTKEEKDSFDEFGVNLVNIENEPKTMDVKEALHMYSWVVANILNSTMEKLTEEPIMLHFFAINKGSNLIPKLNKIITLVNKVQKDSEAYMKRVEFAVSIGCITFSVLAVLVCYIPSIYLIGKQKTSCYNLFESIESGNLRDIFSRCTIKLTEMAGAEETQSHLELLDIQDTFKKSQRSSKNKSSKDDEEDDNDNQKGKDRGKNNRKNGSLGQLKMSHGTSLHFGVFDAFFSSTSMKFFVITLLTAVYFLCFYFWWMYENEMIFTDIDYRIVYSNLRRTYSREIIIEFEQWGLSRNQSNLLKIQEIEQELWKVVHAFSYGEEESGIITDIRVLKGGREIVDADICDQIHHEYPILQFKSEPCKSYMLGIMTRGGHELLLSYISRSTKLRSLCRQAMNGTISLSNEEFLERLAVLQEMEQVWIAVTVTITDEFLEGIFIKEFKVARETRNLGIVAYVMVNALLFVFVYYPTVKFMDGELKGTRRALMIIPHETVDSSDSLRMQMRQIALSILGKS